MCVTANQIFLKLLSFSFFCSSSFYAHPLLTPIHTISLTHTQYTPTHTHSYTYIFAFTNFQLIEVFFLLSCVFVFFQRKKIVKLTFVSLQLLTFKFVLSSNKNLSSSVCFFLLNSRSSSKL